MAICDFCGLDYNGDSYESKNRHLRFECKKNPYLDGPNRPVAKHKNKAKKEVEKVAIHVFPNPSMDNRREQKDRTMDNDRTQTSAIQSNDETCKTTDNGQTTDNDLTIRTGHGTGTYRMSHARPYGLESPKSVQNNRALTPIKFKDFTPAFPKSWIVDGILGAGTLAVLGGKRATFKSTISINLCVRVAAGLQFLGRHTEKVPVLYLDEENGDAHLYDLLKGSINALGANELQKAEYTASCGEGVQILCGEGVAHIWDTLASLNPDSPDCPKLIVMDGLRRFLGSANENDAGEVSVFMQRAKMEAERLGACILFLHHARKSIAGGKGQPDEFEDAMDSLRGSSDIMAAVSTAMITTRVGDSTKVLISFPKTRWGKEPEPVGIEFDIKDDFINMMQTNENNQYDFVVQQHASLVRSWAIRGEHSQFTTEQANAGLAGRLGVKTIQRVLLWMVDNEWIRKPKKGVYEIDLPATGQQELDLTQPSDTGGGRF